MTRTSTSPLPFSRFRPSCCRSASALWGRHFCLRAGFPSGSAAEGANPNLILGRTLHTIDDQNVNRPFSLLKIQANLLPECFGFVGPGIFACEPDFHPAQASKA